MRPIRYWPLALATAVILAAGAASARERLRYHPDAPCGQASTPSGSDSTGLKEAIQHVVCQYASRRLVIVGENHGSNETPALVAALVEAASKYRPVRVGLEWPVWMQSYVVTYLASQGTLNDRESMLRMGYWRMARDGRDSTAMVNLVDSIRRLRRSGRDIDIFMMEPNVPTTPEGLRADPVAWKENGMGSAIKAVLNDAPPKALVVALMGSFHSSYAARKGHPNLSALQQVPDRHPLYILSQANAGSLWNCDTKNACGIHAIKSTYPSPSQHVQIDPLNDVPEGMTAEIFRFPVATASSPSARFEDGAPVGHKP